MIEPLLGLERDDLSGVLHFSAQGVTTNIYARDGDIVYADAGTVGETLGRTLIRAGRMTEEQVAAVIRRMTDALIDNEHVRFGEVVVEYGFLTADELDRALVEQVKGKVMGCVHRGPGAWRFSRDDPRVDEVGSFVVRTRPMLVEAAPSFPERRIEAVLELDHERYPDLVAPESIVAAEFELSTDQASLLSQLDGTSSVHAVLAKAPYERMAPLVAALVLGGGVVLREAPTGVRANREERPIPPQFRSQRRARFTLGAAAPEKKPAPVDAKPSGPSPETLARARAALARLKADLERRRRQPERSPEPKDDKERNLMAGSAFHLGRVSLRAEDLERALPQLRRAHELRPDEPEYELYAKWAEMRKSGTFSDDAARAEIRALATRLVRENRDCELGLNILGHCALHEGNDEAALRFFQRAAALDPKLIEAARFARLLAMRKGGKRRP